MILGMIIGLTSALYVGDEGDMMLLEFNQESFFVVLAPPIFLEAGYNMNRGLFWDHSISIFMLGIVGTYMNAIIFAICFYYFVSHIHSCGLQVGDSFTMEDAIHLAALIAPTDVVAVLSIFKNIPATEKTTALISIAEGESLVNDGVAIVLFWHTGQGFPDELLPEDWGNIVGVVLVPLIFSLSIVGGCLIAIACALTTGYFHLQDKPQTEFLITLAFAYLSYFVFVPVPVVSEFISLFSCGFALAHFNEEHLSLETRVSTTLLFKSWGWIAETFIFFQIGVNTAVSLHDETWAWTQAIPVIALVLLLMVLTRLVVVFCTCLYLNGRGYEQLYFAQQVVLNLASVRGAVSYALCLVWPNVANAETVHTTTLAVVLFTNFLFGSALGPVVRFLFPASQKENQHGSGHNIEDKNSAQKLLAVWGSWSHDVNEHNLKEHDLKDEKLLFGINHESNYDLDDSERKHLKERSNLPQSGSAGEKSWLAQVDENYIQPFITNPRDREEVQIENMEDNLEGYVENGLQEEAIAEDEKEPFDQYHELSDGHSALEDIIERAYRE
eukprot:CAMPEP_0167746850 /NCGR_PEP_ID=MMETSP0110_2-20121227/3946_1 /TAXON_ID=629695 /ORGANISM="Gymnochlora sp., Strain CCMP2014" /LENGTH=554 /DNA_ID=CAMNT_0007631669 /DNA_START=66 /DNA_END=1728 /DNA_ORIENTATION=-